MLLRLSTSAACDMVSKPASLSRSVAFCTAGAIGSDMLISSAPESIVSATSDIDIEYPFSLNVISGLSAR